ncbi:MAG TPA: SdrD B-like domain-containing protein, partial [Methanothrix sp.]|nr:SdrD B-like domain-containing protein [Methanothrix sp.]
MNVNPISSGSSYDVTNQAYDVFVSGSTAYMTEGSFGVEVVNAANGAHQGWCSGWDSNLFAVGIYISGNYAYVGASGGNTGGTLAVLSLTSPNSPSVVNTIETHSMSSGGGLCVTDNKIYLATDNGVDVFSLSSPANPTYLQNFPTPYGAYDVHVFGTNAYVVMGSNPPPGQPNVVVLDLANSGAQTDCYTDSAVPYAIQFYNGKIYIVDPGVWDSGKGTYGKNGLKELSVGSVSGSLTVNLDAVPNDAQDFTFTGTDLGSFTLDDDSEGTYPNTKAFSLAEGYYAFHQTVPSGWIVSSITASDPSKVTYSSDGNSWHSSFTSGDTWAKASVQAGDSTLTVNFQDTRVYSISGHVIYDLDGNGAKNNFEGYVPNSWVVQLWKDGAQTTQTTTLSGAYSFSNLPAGNYEVRSILQTGWVNTLPATGIRTYSPLSSDQTNQDFGVRGSQSIAGMKFNDLDGDRAKDAGEPGLASWTIDLKKDGNKIASTQTAAEGAYSFAGLAPGSYTVEETLQSGWTQSYPASPGTHAVTLVAGVAGPTDRDFGNYQPTGFSGVKFEDSNGNGAKDAGETGISSWTIKLKQGTTEIASTQTGTGGAYSFTGVAPGSYTVEEVAQSGWTQSYPATPGTYPLTLVSGVAGPTNIDFGNWRATGFSGMKFEDLNGNGAKDAGEPGLSGWTIKLKQGATEITSIQTGTGGAYSFTGIAPGSYTVEEVAQSGWTQSYPATPGTYPLTLVSGVAGPTNIDFGNWRATSFSGLKFEDLNGNGAKDAGESGLSGWTIKLMSGATEIAGTQTGADGAYSFTDIAPGSYTVEEVSQAGWARTCPASPGTHPVTLVSGIAGPNNIDFGNARTTGFSGMKFEDLNGNGAKDTGEPGLEGWTIKIMSGATEIASTQTDADGAYSFTDIAPGSYTVKEEVMSGWTQSYPATPGTYPLTLVSGVPGPTNIDFGNWKSTGFSGMKFEDLNGNGAKDAGEPGLSGWTIKLMNGATEIASTQTDADGAYSFT